MTETIDLFCHLCGTCIGKEHYNYSGLFDSSDEDVYIERYPHSKEQCAEILFGKRKYAEARKVLYGK